MLPFLITNTCCLRKRLEELRVPRARGRTRKYATFPCPRCLLRNLNDVNNILYMLCRISSHLFTLPLSVRHYVKRVSESQHKRIAESDSIKPWLAVHTTFKQKNRKVNWKTSQVKSELSWFHKNVEVSPWFTEFHCTHNLGIMLYPIWNHRSL